MVCIVYFSRRDRGKWGNFDIDNKLMSQAKDEGQQSIGLTLHNKSSVC